MTYPETLELACEGYPNDIVATGQGGRGVTELFDHIQDTLGPAFTVMDGGLVNDVQTVYVRINNPYKEE